MFSVYWSAYGPLAEGFRVKSHYVQGELVSVLPLSRGFQGVKSHYVQYKSAFSLKR